MSGWLQSFLDIFFPPTCGACDTVIARQSWPLCADCQLRIRWLNDTWRSDWLANPFFDSLRALAHYEAPLSEAICRLKYERRLDLAKPLAQLLFRAGYVPEVDWIVPVPLSRQRLRKRGYNQSILLGEALSKLTGIPIAHEVLKRVSERPPQVGLSHSERIRNIKGIFELHSKHLSKINGKGILLLDDVVTTGATLDECARQLKKVATNVHVLTLAATR